MSLNYTQIIREIEKNCGFDVGGISNNVQRKADFTADINLALDEVIALIIQNSGTWKFDDTNHTKYPIIYTDLVNGQRDYTFLKDEQGNLILSIYKVYAKGTTGIFNELNPVDVEGFTGNTSDFTDGVGNLGQPTRYDKLANGIFLDPIPSYDSVNGLKIMIDREGSYFTVSDTDKAPGFAGLFHDYLALVPSYKYSLRNTLPTANGYKNAIEEMKAEIKKFYSLRSKDVKKRLLPNVENNK
jgi:hypothetical protein